MIITNYELYIFMPFLLPLIKFLGHSSIRNIEQNCIFPQHFLDWSSSELHVWILQRNRQSCEWWKRTDKHYLALLLHMRDLKSTTEEEIFWPHFLFMTEGLEINCLMSFGLFGEGSVLLGGVHNSFLNLKSSKVL